MPTYEYRCKNCESEFEFVQKMSDEPLKNCIKCGGAVQKLIGKNVCVCFKGSGFYVNDTKDTKSSCGSSTGKCCGKHK